jgi:hypothetical protein
MPVARNVWQHTSVFKTGLARPALHALVGEIRRHPFFGDAAVAIERAKEGSAAIAGDAGGVEVGLDVDLGLRVSGPDELLAAFFGEVEKGEGAFAVVVLDSEADRRGDARKRVEHDGEERAIAQPAELLGGDGVEETARLLGREHRCLSATNRVLGAAHGGSRIGGEVAAGDEPVEAHADRGELELHGGLGAWVLLDVGGNEHWANGTELGDPALCTPVEEAATALA